MWVGIRRHVPGHGVVAMNGDHMPMRVATGNNAKKGGSGPLLRSHRFGAYCGRCGPAAMIASDTPLNLRKFCRNWPIRLRIWAS